MRILHISNTNINFDNRILKELESLESVNYYHLFAIGIYTDENWIDSKTTKRTEIKTIYLISNNFKILPRALQYFFIIIELTFKLLINGIKFKPNIVHCHDTMVLPAGILIKFFLNVKLIYDAHELESNKHGQNKILSKATYLIEYFSWHRIDYFITVSKSINDWYMKKLGDKPSKIILNSPVQDETTRFEKNYFHDKFKIKEERLIFVYIGALAEGRAIDLIVEAFRSSNVSSHVVFIGLGSMHSFVADSARSCDKIHLHSPVAHEKVVPLISSADIGLCLIENSSLSDFYCLPNKLFEYAFSGIPILASKFPDIEFIVEKYNLGFTCNLDVVSIIDEILKIEKEKPQSISSDISDLSWKSQSDKLLDAYNSL